MTDAVELDDVDEAGDVTVIEFNDEQEARLGCPKVSQPSGGSFVGIELVDQHSVGFVFDLLDRTQVLLLSEADTGWHVTSVRARAFESRFSYGHR
ncbi:hypothetical protein [Subtercola lobariae]|uniref:Uncharacterized protein n=1 Tax=Subtercola lobariae TaxID=1588641 RepID=A0A917BIN2_9MICO|nr:hypothetical protein [Subtercola lobariae]GGF41767.1 hypothetical protein GCM10011399_38070 [Subtercola lobariae]